MGALTGATLALYTHVHQPPPLPIPTFRAGECYIAKNHEPWQVYPDGQVLQVGHRLYLLVSREQRNSKDRYNGNKTYGFEIAIQDADAVYQQTECPLAWRK